MAKSYSDNAIMAKVRALYGRRLSAGDYEQLLTKRSIGEIAGYLKNETYFADALKEVKEDLVHREQLESQIYRRTLDIYLRLAKYSYEDKLFLTMHVMKNEIAQLIVALRLLNADEMGKFIISLPLYLSKHMSFDLFAIAGVKGYDDLLAILEHSEYYPIIAKFRPAASTKMIDISSCETALLTHYYTKLLKMVESGYGGDTRSSLRALLYYQIDLHNLTVIYRMKRYFHARPDVVRSKMLPVKAKLNKRVYDLALEDGGIDALLASLRKLRLVRQFPIGADTDAQRAVFQMERIRRHLFQKIFRFSMKPVVVVVCYMVLLEIEASNITNIIEGIRYNLPKEEIWSMLVL